MQVVDQTETISLAVYEGGVPSVREVEVIRKGKTLFLHESVEEGWLCLSVIDSGYQVVQGQGLAVMSWALDQLDDLPLLTGDGLLNGEKRSVQFARDQLKIERVRSLVQVAAALELPAIAAADLARGLAHQAYKIYSMACLIDPIAADDVFQIAPNYDGEYDI